MDFTPLQTLLVFVATLCGETFGTIFGGGSFFTQPGLLVAGVPANMAVANDVTAAVFSSAMFVHTFRKAPRKLDNKQLTRITLLMAPGFIVGAFIGGNLMSQIPESTMRWVIIAICALGLVYTVLKFKTPAANGKQGFIAAWPLFAVLGALGIGFYDGLSGAGSGVLIILLLTFLFRQDMKTTIFLTNILSIISMAAAAITFYSVGLLSAPLLMVMVPACLLAGLLAGKIALWLPEKTLRLIYGSVIALLLVYLLFGMA